MVGIIGVNETLKTEQEKKNGGQMRYGKWFIVMEAFVHSFRIELISNHNRMGKEFTFRGLRHILFESRNRGISFTQRHILPTSNVNLSYLDFNEPLAPHPPAATL